MAGSGVTLYAVNAAGNKAIVGTIDWRENIYLPSQINDNLAQIMADIRAMANSIGAGWIEIGDADGTYTAVYAGPNDFEFGGVNVTAYYRVGMRIRVVAPTPGALVGTIVSSAFASSNTHLTVTWDAGVLSNEAITSVQIMIGSGDTGLAATGTRHDCRFDFVNTTTCRLSRFGGNKLTIDAQLCTIPAAGVNLTFDAGWGPSGALYVYAVMVGGVMTLTVAANTPAWDARDGNLVMSGNPAASVVGMIVVGYGTYIQDATHIGVLSYWNRLAKSTTSYVNGVTSGSTTPIIVAALAQNVLSFGDEAINMEFAGFGGNNAAGVNSVATDLCFDGNSLGCTTVGHSGGAGYMVAQSCSRSVVLPVGWRLVGPYVYVSGGAGTWTGHFSTTVRG